MSGLIQETKIAFGRVRQAGLHTANVLAELIRLNKLNAALTEVVLNTESDEDEIGKGHEFAENSYKTSWDVSGQMEKYLSAEFAAWAFAFALGKVATAGTGPYTHTITPLDVVADGIDLPAFSFIETIRQGANDILDRMAVGCCVEDVTLTIASGPGRANSKIVANFVGCGKLTRLSGIAIPSATAENLLPSASLALSVNGTDYIATKRIIILELQWKNNVRLDTGFYPGSGFQTPGDPDSGAIRGRMEHGKRTLSLRFSARFEDGSPELTTLENQSEGTAVITLSGANGTSLDITFHRTWFRSVRVDNTDGIVSADTDLLPMMHAGNGLITVEAVNTLATVG